MTLDSYASSHTPIVPNILMENDRGGDSEECWICLSNEGTLTRPCECPRVCHRECIATWQLTNYGRREENYCRFCNKKLPALWKADPLQDAAADELRVAPVMAVRYNGPDGTREFRLRVQPGPEGLATFKRHLKELLGFDVGPEFDVTFECQMPATGSTLTLSGLNAYGAATHCAALLAATKSSPDSSAPAEGPSSAPATTPTAAVSPSTPPTHTAHPTHGPGTNPLLPALTTPQPQALLPVTTRPTQQPQIDPCNRRRPCQTGYLSSSGSPTTQTAATGSRHSVGNYTLRTSQSISAYGCSSSTHLASPSAADRPSGSRPRPNAPCSAAAGGSRARQAARRASGTLLTAGGPEYDSQDDQDPLEDRLFDAGRRDVRHVEAMSMFEPMSVLATEEAFGGCGAEYFQGASKAQEGAAATVGRVADANTRIMAPDHHVLGHMLSEASTQLIAPSTANRPESALPSSTSGSSSRRTHPEHWVVTTAVGAAVTSPASSSGRGTAEPTQTSYMARRDDDVAGDPAGSYVGMSSGGNLSQQAGVHSGGRRFGHSSGTAVRDRPVSSRAGLPQALRNTAERTLNSMMRALQHVTLKPTTQTQAPSEGTR